MFAIVYSRAVIVYSWNKASASLETGLFDFSWIEDLCVNLCSIFSRLPSSRLQFLKVRESSNYVLFIILTERWTYESFFSEEINVEILKEVYGVQEHENPVRGIVVFHPLDFRFFLIEFLRKNLTLSLCSLVIVVTTSNPNSVSFITKFFDILWSFRHWWH